MKKVLLFIIGLLFFIPNDVLAVSITNTRVEGINEAKIGTEFSLGFFVKYDEVKKDSANDTYGVWVVAYELIFDDEVFMVSGVESNVWDTIVYKEDGKYYVLSEIGENNPDRNKCVDNILYCSEYGVSIKFFVKDTDKTTSTIKMGEVDVEVFPVQGGINPKYNEEDAISLTAVSNKSQTITIKKNESTKIETPKEVVQNSKPEITEPKVSEEVKIDTSKSGNTYLKDLTIKGHAIAFYKRTREYEIELDEGENSLVIDAKLDDERSVLEVVGADNLKANNYKVIINVTAENGLKDTYTIIAKKEKNNDSKKLKVVDIITQVKEIFNDYKLYILIGLGVLIFIIILSIIVNKINDNKLRKKFDDF